MSSPCGDDLAILNAAQSVYPDAEKTDREILLDVLQMQRELVTAVNSIGEMVSTGFAMLNSLSSEIAKAGPMGLVKSLLGGNRG